MMNLTMGSIGSVSFQATRTQSEYNVIQRERELSVGRVCDTEEEDGYTNAEMEQTRIEEELHDKAAKLRYFSLITQQRVREATRKQRELKKLKEKSSLMESRHRMESLEDCAAKYITNQNKENDNCTNLDNSELHLMQYLPTVLDICPETPTRRCVSKIKDEVCYTHNKKQPSFISMNSLMFSGPNIGTGSYTERPPLAEITDGMNTSIDPFQLSSVSSASDTIAEPGNSTQQFLKAMKVA